MLGTLSVLLDAAGAGAGAARESGCVCHLWQQKVEKKMAAASGIALELVEFLNAAPTPFHAVGMLGYILLFFTISFLLSCLSPTKLRIGFWGSLGFGFGKSGFFWFYFARVFSCFGYEGRMKKVFLCFRGGGCLWLGFIVVVLQQRKPNRG